MWHQTTLTLPRFRRGFHLVTRQVLDAIPQLREVCVGLLHVFIQHTSASLTINENADPDVRHDMLRKLETLIPKHEAYYRHGEGNSDSHVKTSLVGNSVTVLVERGRLVLGRWQGIYFCEFDGPREREMMVKAVMFGAAGAD